MSNEPAKDFFVTDAPFHEDDERDDLLEREWFAEQVALRIGQAGTGNSVVFGLAGPWGAGKTSTVTLIKKALKVNDDPWAVVEFTPWAVSNELALTEEFYNTIASALDDKSERTAENGKKLLNLAAPILAAAAKAITIGVVKSKVGEGAYQDMVTAAAEAGADAAGEFQFEKNPFAERFAKISNFLENLGLRVLVIVDDVDRLHHDELLAVMKAVRLLGRFKGVHYLLSYDTQTVTDVLTRSDLANGNRRRAEQYLEKIVQYPFQLPPTQDIHLASVIDEHLRELTQRFGYDSTRSERDLDVLLSRLPLDHLTLRTVHRLFAQVDMMLTLITEKGSRARPCDEIDLLDAILVTYLRLEHHDLYRQLVTWKSELTHRTGTSFDADKERERANTLREKIKQTIDPNGQNHTETLRALAVLRGLFPDAVPRVDDAYSALPKEAPFQIRKSMYFERYFTFGFPANDIRDEKVRAYLIELIETGNLSPESVIRTHADDRVRRSLLHTKVQNGIAAALEQAADLSHCGDAAIALTRLTTEQERNEPHRDAWWAAVTFQLWQALEANHGTGQSQVAVANYLDAFGTDMTAIAAHIGRLSPESTLWDTTKIVWNRIHDEIVDALLDNRHDMPDPNPAIRYGYWIEHYPLLSERMQVTIEQRTADPAS